jgi:hypothetical protein
MDAPVIRLYESLGLTFPEEAQMPPGATAEFPPCFLCRRRSRLPPAKVGFVSAGEVERLFQICADCDVPDPAELEALILARVSAGPAMADAPPAAAARPAWAHRAAQAWAKPLTVRQKPAA